MITIGIMFFRYVNALYIYCMLILLRWSMLILHLFFMDFPILKIWFKIVMNYIMFLKYNYSLYFYCVNILCVCVCVCSCMCFSCPCWFWANEYACWNIKWICFCSEFNFCFTVLHRALDFEEATRYWWKEVTVRALLIPFMEAWRNLVFTCFSAHAIIRLVPLLSLVTKCCAVLYLQA
jgi:hypothetical protein